MISTCQVTLPTQRNPLFLCVAPTIGASAPLVADMPHAGTLWLKDYLLKAWFSI